MESQKPGSVPHVLICDDDSAVHLAVKHGLKSRFDLRSAYNGDEAQAILKAYPADVVLLDIQMRTPDEGLKLIPALRDQDPSIQIVMISGRTDFSAVREAMRLGAVDYVPKDFDPNDLGHVISRVVERKQLLDRCEQQNFEALKTQSQHVLVGSSAPLQSLRKMIEKLKKSPANVVITGETGTGKEVVARQLRASLPDGSLAPFVAVDSSTIQSTTAESLLFGHEKGAFTGADKATKGIFEEANGGIVYFDEISNMPLDIQAKLLRVLQEKEVTRLGSSKTIKLEFRVVCATNKNLDEMAKAGQFKDDLLQRLNVLPVSLPPLRERKGDIPELVNHFASKHSPAGADPLRFTEEAIQALQAYEWPGNIRELSNLVAYVIAMTEGNEVDLADLPPKTRDAETKAARSAATSSGAAADEAAGSFYDRVAEFERRILNQEYSTYGGNISKLALKLGMDRSHLYTKLKEYGIHATRPK